MRKFYGGETPLHPDLVRAAAERLGCEWVAHYYATCDRWEVPLSQRLVEVDEDALRCALHLREGDTLRADRRLSALRAQAGENWHEDSAKRAWERAAIERLALIRRLRGRWAEIVSAASPAVSRRLRAFAPHGYPRWCRCYDNRGESGDRYLFVMTGRHAHGFYRAMSTNPFHPQGIGISDCAERRGGQQCPIDRPKSSHLGDRIPFEALPVDCMASGWWDFAPDEGRTPYHQAIWQMGDFCYHDLAGRERRIKE